MRSHYLEKLFNPAAIAVIGASDRPHSVGHKVFKNLLAGNFLGQIYAVNPKHKHVQGQPCFSTIKDIDQPIDLVVITTPAQTIASILVECGEKGIKTAIIISSGFSEIGTTGKELEKKLLDVAHHYGIRIIGPNCLGVMQTHIKMNATFDNNFALPGNMAFVSQSGALSAAILDWAMEKDIGFSTLVSLGNSADIGFGDVLDYLAMDPHTKSILLYIEGIHNARHFMSGLRAAARIKPVIVIKAGRRSQGSRAALSHTGALIGDDDVFDVALRRAGAVRVMTIEELFSAAEILSSNYRVKGNRLFVITNGGGAGVMAADRASDLNVVLPNISEDMVSEFNKILPSQWSHQNPIDIIGDATPERYHATLDICAKYDNFDALLTILVPVAMSQPIKVAKQLISDAKKSDKPILACWMGNKQVKSSWKMFDKNKIPCFDTPEKAVQAFSYLSDYQFNQKLLMQIPGPLSPQSKPDIVNARSIIDAALKEGRSVLTTIESKNILKAFLIPVLLPVNTQTQEEAVKIANSFGYPVVLKINSPDISHKQDVGGVILNVNSDNELRIAYEKISIDVKKIMPNAKILGITVEPMLKNPNNRELMIGVIRDIVFGPVISFGAGGTLVEIIKDRALALPPLNQFIANRLISQTNISKTLGSFRNMQPVNSQILVNALLRVSEIVCELPAICEMDINPLIINEKELIAIDARIVISKKQVSYFSYSHMAIHPYPNHLLETHHLSNNVGIVIRPIRPEDAEIEFEFVRNLSEQSKHFRFFEVFKELSPSMLVRFTQIDYDREMAFIATYNHKDKEIAIGVARYSINADMKSCEFALVIADAWQNKGIGSILMTSLVRAAKTRGLKEMIGVVLSDNVNMLKLAKNVGFVISNTDDPTVKFVTKVIS